MDPYGSVWSLRTPWGLPGAFWGPGGPQKGVKGFLAVGTPRVGPVVGLSRAVSGSYYPTIGIPMLLSRVVSGIGPTYPGRKAHLCSWLRWDRG